ncbi:MAG TPA: hypothetical protein DCL35_01440 [Candidatus Omnitrophica bacterium]|nr:hypothetical protein [Candidatus Omnitrophota bacterium]
MSNLFKKFRGIVLISRDVCRSALRERMMYGFLLLAFLFILMANVPFAVNDPKAFDGQPPAVSAVQIGFVSINIFMVLITVFVSLSTLQNFLDRQRLVLLLSKPLSRWQIIEGVMLGLFETVFLNWCLMTAGVWLVILSQTRELAFYVWSGMSVTALMSLLYVSLVVFFYIIIPNSAAGVLTIFLLIAGLGVPFAQELFDSTRYPHLVSSLLRTGLNVLPKVNDLWGISMTELGLFGLKIQAGFVILHTIALIAVLNAVVCFKFRRFRRA